MKIELKNIQFFERMSEETNCYVAWLYVDGVKVAEVKNDGRGGETWVRAISGSGKAIRALEKAEQFCKDMPLYEGLKMDLPFYLDLQLEKWITAKHQQKWEKKMLKQMQTNIITGKKENGQVTEYRKWKLNYPLDVIKATPGRLEKMLEGIKSKLSVGEEILNTNLQ